MAASKLLRVGLWLLGATLLAVVGLRAWAAWAADREPGLGAEWIWADGAAEDGGAVAFWAVRDLWLDPDDRSASGDRGEAAWLSIVADAEYVAWVNGRRIGSGWWRADQRADRYEITDVLEPGMNRLAIELRSPRGAGGVLASLRLGAEDRAVLGTDGSWRILRREVPELLRGLGTLDALGGEPPRVWGPPPAGRWRPRGAESTTPILPALGDEAPASSERFVAAVAARHATGVGRRWVDLRFRPRFPRLAPQVIFDFGRVVEGHLEIGLPCAADDRDADDRAADARSEVDGAATDSAPLALVFVGETPPRVHAEPPDTILVAPRGACTWRDAAARRFRYAAVVGLAPSRRVEVDRLHAPGAVVASEVGEREGVFGLPPARGWSAVEEEVWDRLADRRGRVRGDPAGRR